MISCVIRYRIDATKTADFERYARRWIPLVERFGGRHLGYFLPSEGASDVALAVFNFESMAAYERYRAVSATDPDCLEAYRFAEETGCILRYERSFFRPVTRA